VGVSAGGLVPRRAPTLRVCALYPDLMNIYADRGNLLVLERRCAWRGIDFRLTGVGLGERLDGEGYDIYYLGGGQDRDQRLCAGDLYEDKREALHAAAARGAVVLGVCGGYQLLGASYELEGEVLPGVGLLDLRTVRERGERLIGNVAVEVDLDGEGDGVRAGGRSAYGEGAAAVGERGAVAATRRLAPRVLAGFENHGGRTCLGASATPLGRVIKGYGNDGRSGFEGARAGSVIGTYLHGPLLPKNAWFADWLIAQALGVDADALAPLDDELEGLAHESARRAAGIASA
jgi:lipid II isoglutaminyl synthase (glutamine-hydrolysing)